MHPVTALEGMVGEACEPVSWKEGHDFDAYQCFLVFLASVRTHGLLAMNMMAAIIPWRCRIRYLPLRKVLPLLWRKYK